MLLVHFGHFLVFNSQSDVQDETVKLQITSHESHDEILQIKPSLVHIAFLLLIDQVSKLLQSCDVKKFIEQCENLMACEQESIKLFSNDQIEILSQYNSTLSLLRSLSCFFTWNNHSILRMLLNELSSEALQLMDEFDSRVDPLQSVLSYPIPCFSSDMIPVDTSTHTILAIRCDQELYKSTLQYVYDMQSLMMEKCDITQHCLQLLAVRNNPAILYWTIPTCVIKLISNYVPQHSEYLYSKGVLEVLVYPELWLTTGDDVVMGSLAFKPENSGEVCICSYLSVFMYVKY